MIGEGSCERITPKIPLPRRGCPGCPRHRPGLLAVRLGRPIGNPPGHDCPVYAVAFSPDGKLIASGGADRVVRVWDVATRRDRARLIGHTGFIGSIAFSPDGKTLATTAAPDDSGLRLWDISSGRLCATVPGPEMPSWARQDRLRGPDGSLRVEADRRYAPRTLSLIEARTDRKLVVLDGHPDQLNDWAFAPGGEILATGGGYTSHPWPVNPAGDVRVWEVRTGRLLAKLDNFWGAVSDVEFSPGGEILAAASYGGTIRVWNVSRIFRR